MLECVLRELNLSESMDADYLIEKHMPFIVKTISEVTGRYVSCENDEEVSVGLLAFNEAIERFDDDKGHFLSFAKLVISSRIKNYLKSENRHQHTSFDELVDNGMDLRDEYVEKEEENKELVDEITLFKEKISSFGFGLEELVEEAPKQQATRINAINLSRQISNEQDLVDFMNEKKRLPISKIVSRFDVTEKVVKRSKKFIISVVIIITDNMSLLKNWIRK